MMNRHGNKPIKDRTPEEHAEIKRQSRERYYANHRDRILTKLRETPDPENSHYKRHPE